MTHVVQSDVDARDGVAGLAEHPFATADIGAEFDRVASAYPRHVAVVDDRRELTYARLLAAADAFADRLREAGVLPGARVGVAVRRSAESIVALLGILKAGGAYVPVEPEHLGTRRAEMMLRDAGVGLVVAPAAARDVLPARFGIVDEQGAVLRPAVARLSVPGAAYVMFTSGTTGTPKGVEVTHGNVVQLVRGQAYARFEPDETFLHWSALSFDASTLEIWGALLCGARLVVAPPRMDVLADLPGLLRRQRVTVAFVTTSLFHELVDLDVTTFDGLRQVLVGGERLSLPHAWRMVRHAREVPAAPEVINGYGPTETTTFATWFPLRELMPTDGDVPIGRPLAHSRVMVADGHGDPLPDGVVGEIWIAGAGVARGYVDAPELTRERFVDRVDPGGHPQRWYRTGDLGIRRGDGRYEHRGRNDEQIKVRGFRVEPGEVEAALLTHAQVRSAAVTAIVEEGRPARLVAAVIAREPARLDADAMREHLAERLPDFMVPHRVRVVDAFPRTLSGKLDRRQLAGLLAADEPVTPGPWTSASPTARTLRTVWRDVLGIPTVGLDDDFFVLGGDSIIVLRLVAQADRHGVELSIADVYTCRTVRALAQTVDSRSADGRDDEPVDVDLVAEADRAVVPAGLDAFPAGALQVGLVYEAERSDDGQIYHDVISVTVAAPLVVARAERVLHRIAERHDVLRARFDLGGFSQPMLLVQPTSPLRITTSDWTDLDATERKAASAEIRARLSRQFDVEREPLLRVHVAALSPERFELFLGFHHAILDGWSTSVLLREFAVWYGDETVRLPATPSYREFVRLEQAAATSAMSAGFWADVTAAMTPTLLHPPGTASSARIRESRTLRAHLTTRSRAAATARSVSVKHLLLGAHLRVLGQWCGRPDPVSGLVVNGRPEDEHAAGMVGLFLNIVPVSVTLADAAACDLVERVVAAETALLPHRRYPYPRLRERTGQIFDTVFNYVRFRFLAEVARDTPVRLGPQRVSDKASFPLMVEFVDDPVDGSLELLCTGDGAYWNAGSLGLLAQSYVDELSRLTDELGEGSDR